MNKKELVQEIMAQMAATPVTLGQINEVVTHALDLIREESHAGSVKLKGFGSFKVISVKGRMGRNPQTGEVIAIPPRQKLTFKASV